jgi:hypothetical protein
MDGGPSGAVHFCFTEQPSPTLGESKLSSQRNQDKSLITGALTDKFPEPLPCRRRRGKNLSCRM